MSWMKTKRARWVGRSVAILSIGLLWVSSVSAEEKPPAFMNHLYAPELVMQNHRAIDLRKDQRKTITRAIQKTQSATIELQWAMQDAASELQQAIMSSDTIDEAKALAIAERMMEIEGRVKRAHLGLLIRIRNALDPAQRKRLGEIRAGR